MKDSNSIKEVKKAEHIIDDIIWYYKSALNQDKTIEYFAPLIREWAKENYGLQSQQPEIADDERIKKLIESEPVNFFLSNILRYLTPEQMRVLSDNLIERLPKEIATDIELEKLAEDYCKKEEYGYALQPHIIPAFMEGYAAALNKKGIDSDAVELMEWLKKSPFYCDPRYWYDAENLHDKITPEAIYKLFKHSKSLPPIQSKQL